MNLFRSTGTYIDTNIHICMHAYRIGLAISRRGHFLGRQAKRFGKMYHLAKVHGAFEDAEVHGRNVFPDQPYMHTNMCNMTDPG